MYNRSVGTWWTGWSFTTHPVFSWLNIKKIYLLDLLQYQCGFIFVVCPIKFRGLPTPLITLCDRCTFRQTEQNYWFSSRHAFSFSDMLLPAASCYACQIIWLAAFVLDICKMKVCEKKNCKQQTFLSRLAWLWPCHLKDDNLMNSIYCKWLAQHYQVVLHNLSILQRFEGIQTYRKFTMAFIDRLRLITWWFFELPAKKVSPSSLTQCFFCLA